MKILLTGSSGQVGHELERSLQGLGEVVALDRHRMDLSDLDQVRDVVRTLRPGLIVNPAAYTAVDKAESEPDFARLLNATTPGAVAREAAAIGALLVHYSTDYVFDGSGQQARAEDAPTAPLSVYGSTKLEGEQLIAASGCRHLIFRTSWVYAARGGNFAKTMLRLASEREALSVINDQVGAPTGADLLADVTAHAIRAVAAQPELAGLYHLVAGGETTWFDYARFVIEWARSQGQPITVAAQAVAPVPTSAFPTAAKRPLNSRLNTQKLQHAFGLSLPHWQLGVERMLTEHLG